MIDREGYHFYGGILLGIAVGLMFCGFLFVWSGLQSVGQFLMALSCLFSLACSFVHSRMEKVT